MYLCSTGDLAYDVLIMLRQTNNLVEKAIDRRCRMNGITQAGFEVLYIVAGSSGGITAYRLSKMIGREHHSMVEIVNRLKKKGLIARSGTEPRSDLKVTEAGLEVISKIMQTGVIREVIGGLGSDKLGLLRDRLGDLRTAALKELGDLDKGLVELKIPGV